MMAVGLFSAAGQPTTVHGQWSPVAVGSPGPGSCVAVGMFWVCGTYRSEGDCARALAAVGGHLVSPLGDRIALSCLRSGGAWRLEGPMT